MHNSIWSKLVLSALLLLAVAWYGYRLAVGETTTPFENFLVTIIIAAGSWLLSYWVSRSDAENTANKAAASKIDAIARQSSQKLSDQSTNIFELEQFVEEILLNKETEENVDETDLYGLIQMLRTLRRTNTGLMEDWNGVASDDVSKGISEQARKQSELFKHIARPTGNDGSENHQSEIESISRELPASAVPSRPIRSNARLIGDVQQSMTPASSTKSAEGELTIHTLRPDYKFTASGKFDPWLDTPPEIVWAELLEAPKGCPKNVRVRAGTGTVYDFSVHLKSEEWGIYLPEGRYRLKYRTR